MSLEIYNSIIALLANALRFYALRHFVCIFAPKETCRWKYVFPLYLAGWGCTSLVGLWFSSPAMNIMANVASLFIIFLPYPLKRAMSATSTLTDEALSFIPFYLTVQDVLYSYSDRSGRFQHPLAF